MNPGAVAVFLLPIAAAVGLLAHIVLSSRAAARLLLDFEERWRAKASLVLPCVIWRAGQKRRGAVAVSPQAVAFRAEGTREDIEIPLTLLSGAGIRNGPGGKKLVDLNLAGERLLFEVAPASVDALVGTLGAGAAR